MKIILSSSSSSLHLPHLSYLHSIQEATNPKFIVMVTLPRRRNGAVQSSACDNKINLASAKEIWAQALRLDPPSPSQSFVKLQRLLCRLQGLHEPVLTKSETSHLHVNVGLLLAYLGETALAAQSFQQAVEFDKSSAIGWHALGGMAFLLGMWPEAGEAWTQCWHCFGSQQESIIYHMWKIGGGCAFSESGKREREWELQKTDVEWNMKFAYSNNGWQREYMQERLWTVNGVPSGLFFGPSLLIDCSYFDDGQGHCEAASANILQHNSTGTRQSNRTTSKCATNFTKPLPHLPSIAGSATLLIHRPQKTFLPRWPLFKIRALSPDKSKSHQQKRPEHSTAPLLPGDPMASCPVLQRPSRDLPAAKIGGLFSSKSKFFEPSKNKVFTCDSLVENTFHTDSESESDEEGYYLPTRPVLKHDVEPFFAKSVPGASDADAISPDPTISSNFGRAEISSPIARAKSPSTQPEVRHPIQVDTIVEDEEWNIVATSYSHPSAASIGSVSPPSYPLRSSSILYLLREAQQSDPNIEMEVFKSDILKGVSPHTQQDAKPQVAARKPSRIENIILGTKVTARKPNRIEKILLEKRSHDSPVQTISEMPDQVRTSFEENEPGLSSSSNTGTKGCRETSIADSMTMEITVMLDQSCSEVYKPEIQAPESSESRGRSEKCRKPAKRQPAKLEPSKPEQTYSKPANQEPENPEPIKSKPAMPEPAIRESVMPEPAMPEATTPDPGKPKPAELEQEPTKRELTKSQPDKPRAPRSTPAARGTVKSKIAKWEETVRVDVMSTEPKRASPISARPATYQSPTIQPATTQLANQSPTIQPGTTQAASRPAKAGSRKIQLKDKAAPMKPSPEGGVGLLNPVRFEGFAGEWRALDLIYEAEQKLKESQTWNSETSKRVRFEYSSSGWKALDPECRPSRW